MTDLMSHRPEFEIRQEKLQKILQSGKDPYPARVSRSHRLTELRTHFDDLVEKQTVVSVVGRVVALRSHGGSTFGDLEDTTDRFQFFFQKDLLGEEYDELLETLDRGDFLEVHGVLFRTKTGQESLKVQQARIITKTLLPLPEKWHGLTDTEARYRQRYLDLLSNPSVKAHFMQRAKIISTIRHFLDNQGFLEVDTPILQTLAGGATARPFVTHHHALDMDLYLRVAPELFLKRLLVGGIERVYEVARCFRNEGMDYSHNPEFTQVEFYAAYWDYEQLMKFIEQLFVAILEATHHSCEILYEGKTIDFTPPYPRLRFRDALKQYADIDLEDYPDQSGLQKKAQELGLEIAKSDGRGKIADELYKNFVRPKLTKPTFLVDHPVDLSPLTKRKVDNPNYVERFQLIAAGIFELCNAFSELNDPQDQEERFRAQEDLRKVGDEEAQRLDTDFLDALRHGMPPAAGVGIGIDRLAMLLTGQHTIKEVILFPTMKPLNEVLENSI